MIAPKVISRPAVRMLTSRPPDNSTSMPAGAGPPAGGDGASGGGRVPVLRRRHWGETDLRHMGERLNRSPFHPHAPDFKALRLGGGRFEVRGGGTAVGYQDRWKSRRSGCRTL